MTVIASDSEAIPKKERIGMPWLTESAIMCLEKILRPDLCVLETGMGESTIYFRQKCEMVISIEHDEAWYNKITERLLKPSFFTLFRADRPYNNIIDALPNNSFAIILIDGRDRVKCIQSSIPKLKSGGWLIVDNSEREYYKPGIDLMKDWNRIDCKQNRPDKYDFTYPDWTTSIFIKP